MSFDPRYSALERKVAALEQRLGQLRGSQGVSTSGGVASFRTMQLGFAAELTSTYDPVRGYSWKRKFLDVTVPGLTNPGIQPTGDQAFAADDNKLLKVGTKVWMEPSPDATGYLIMSSTDANAAGTGCDSIDCGGVAGLTKYHCPVGSILSVAGICDCVDTDADWTSILAWDNVSAWVAPDTLTICGVVYTVKFSREHDPDGGDPQLTLTSSGSAPVTYYGTWVRTCSDHVVFAVGWPICTGPIPCPVPAVCDNVMLISIDFSICGNPDWHGSGWYCVTIGTGKSCSTPADVTCRLLTTDPGTCDPTSGDLITICSGPWVDEATCNTNCTGGGTPPDPPDCPSDFGVYGDPWVPGDLVITDRTGSATCLPDSIAPDTTIGLPYHWHTSTCEGNIALDVACTGGKIIATVDCGTLTLVSYFIDAHTAILVYDYTAGTCLDGVGPGTARLTFTLTHP